MNRRCGMPNASGALVVTGADISQSSGSHEAGTVHRDLARRHVAGLLQNSRSKTLLALARIATRGRCRPPM
jgi:hypothetical protein